MTKKKNNLFPATQKIFYNRKISHVYIPNNPTPLDSTYPYNHPISNSEAPSFIVDWQLPKKEVPDFDKSVS